MAFQMSPAATALYDQLMAHARDTFPEHTPAWHEVWLLRYYHFREHDGDMTGAPDFPLEDGDYEW